MARAEPDPYLVLGVGPDASEEEIRAAYRALVKRLHPDAQPNDPDAGLRFRELREAYERLRSAPPRRPASRSQSEAEDFAKVFEEKRAKARFGRSPYGQKGDRGEVEVPFAASVIGGDHRLVVRFRHDPQPKHLLITLPAGMSTDDRIKVEGKVLKVIVRPDPFLRRRGQDVELSLPLSVSELCLGTELLVPSARGPVSLVVPPGTEAGAELRLPGLGVPPTGAQICVVQLVLPNMDDPAARAAVEALARHGGHVHRPWEE